MSKFLKFTIGAADAKVKTYVPAGNYLITTPSTSTVVLTAIGGVATADVITITFTTADATYKSHTDVIEQLTSLESAKNNPEFIQEVVLPKVGAVQQLITSIVIA